MTATSRMLPAIAALALVLVGCATASTPGPRGRLRGVRFAIDTAETPAPARGAFKTFTGVVEFAAGRGRLDVTAARGGPTLAVNGVAIAMPLARPGDYYLFDSTGFVLVRPTARGFSSFVLSRASFRQGDVIAAEEGFMEFARLRADTVTAGDSSRLRQHGPVTLRWHLDRRHAAGPVDVLARGWLDLQDAPAGEASAVRWFGAAAALATMPGGLGALPPDSLQLTAAVILSPPGERGTPVNLIVLHALSAVAVVDIDPTRLVLPAGFTETLWPGFERTSGLPELARDAGARWRTMPITPGK